MEAKSDVEKKADIYLSLYSEELAYCKHHESLRIQFLSVILTLVTIVTALITYDSDLDTSDVFLEVAIILLGVFGLIVHLKSRERFIYHYTRARGFLRELDSCNSDLGIIRVEKLSQDFFDSKDVALSSWRLVYLWTSVYIAVVLLGIILIIITLI